MIKYSFPRALGVLGIALVLGLFATLGTTTRHNAEAASDPAIMMSSATSVSPDICTSTQTGYGYGGYGYGYTGYAGIYGAYGVPYGVVNPYAYGYNSWNYPPDLGSYSGGTYSTNCNYTGCSAVPYYATLVVCPGPPASIQLPSSPTASTCASSENITVTVRDANGLLVADGTEVNFATNFGQITGSAQVQDGKATGSLQTPTKTMGTAVISITSGGASAPQMSIIVSCNAPGSVAFGSQTASPVQTYSAAPAPQQGYSYGGY